MPHPPTLLRITSHATPHHSDPPDADILYAMIGKVVVAWGRLEGHVIGCLLIALQLPEIASPAPKLPMQWKERLALWKRTFQAVPLLQPHTNRAVAFMERLVEEAEDRNFVAHAVWDEFAPDAPEPTIPGRKIKAKTGGSGILETTDMPLTISVASAMLTTANLLNFQLVEFSTLLQSLQPTPAEVRTL